MTQDVGCDRLDVFRRDIITRAEPGTGAGTSIEREGGTRAGTVAQPIGQFRAVRRRVAGRHHQMHKVVLDVRRQIQIENRSPRGKHATLTDPLRSRRGFPGHRLAAVQAEYRLLGGQIGIVDPHMHQKTVELRLRQRVGALLLDRVLRCHDQKQVRQAKRLAAYRDLALTHCLEQCRLHLGRRTVDLVGQYDVVKHRALVEMETAVLRAVDLGARQVGWQQVRSELDAVKVTLDTRGQGLDRPRLGKTRGTLDQQMTIRKQRNQQAFDQRRLTEYLPFHVAA